MSASLRVRRGRRGGGPWRRREPKPGTLSAEPGRFSPLSPPPGRSPTVSLTPSACVQVGRTLFKKVCRRKGIEQWPHCTKHGVSTFHVAGFLSHTPGVLTPLGRHRRLIHYRQLCRGRQARRLPRRSLSARQRTRFRHHRVLPCLPNGPVPTRRVRSTRRCPTLCILYHRCYSKPQSPNTAIIACSCFDRCPNGRRMPIALWRSACFRRPMLAVRWPATERRTLLPGTSCRMQSQTKKITR